MATANGKASKPKAGGDPSQNALKVTAEPGTDRTAMLAKVALRPSIRAAVTIQAFAKSAWGELDLTALADELSGQISAVTKGDLQRAEAMLIAQAHTLEALFYELARRAGLNMGEYLQAAETYMRLALKAQSQCRATLETLAAIKNPAPVAFVRQANIAHGPQQVNNNPPPAGASRARESEIAPNELLEVTDGKRLDIGAAPQAVGADSRVEAVGTIDRTKNA
jgi:hypothetical protein